MASTASRTESARGFARRMVQRQMSIVAHYGEALQLYADSLDRFVQGDMNATEFGKDIMRLSSDQATRTAEDAIELCTEYYRWLWSMVGVRVRSADAAEDQQRSDVGPAESFMATGRS